MVVKQSKKEQKLYVYYIIRLGKNVYIFCFLGKPTNYHTSIALFKQFLQITEKLDPIPETSYPYIVARSTAMSSEIQYYTYWFIDEVEPTNRWIVQCTYY